MKEVATIGLDIAKEVFQAHGADAEGATVFNRRIRRAELLQFFAKLPHCLVGLEASSTAHYWARSIANLGHEVRLIPAQYVKPFVKRGKTDANDAEAINEALTRKTMRYVPVKSIGQQAAAVIFRARDLLVRQKTQTCNALRGHLAEFGFTAKPGASNVKVLAAIVRDETEMRLPEAARSVLLAFVDDIEHLEERIEKLDREVRAQANSDEAARRLMTIPGVGPITAIAMTSSVPDINGFKSGRHFSAWIGLTPRPYSSGGKTVVGHISRMGNRQLRSLLVMGSISSMRVKDNSAATSWLSRLRKRRPFRVAAVALANKNARIIWALLVKGGQYRAPGGLAAVEPTA